MRFTGFLLATALGVILPAAAIAQEEALPVPDIVLTEEQAAQLSAMRQDADAIDKFSDPRAYRVAYEEIVAYALTIYPPDHPEIAILEGEIDFAYFMLGELAVLPARLLSQRDIYAAAGPAYRAKYIEITNNLGVLYQSLGDSTRSLEFQRLAVELWREDAPPEGSPELVQGLNNLAWTERGLGNTETALALADEALAIAEPLLVANPDDGEIADAYAVGINNRVIYLILLDRGEDAREALREGIVRTSAILGPDHPRVGTLMLNGSNLLLQTGQFVAAEETARSALAIRETAYGAESPSAAEARLNLIAALTSQGRDTDALPLAEYTVARLTESQGENAPQTLEARSKLAGIYQSVGRADEGFSESERLLAAYRATRPGGHTDITWELRGLSLGYARAGRWEESRGHLVDLERIWRDSPDEFRTPFPQILALRAVLEARLGNAEMAQAYLDEAEPALLAAWQDQVGNEGAGGGVDIGLDWALGWAASAARDLGDDARGFDLAQYMGVGPSERGLLRARQREAAGDPTIAAALRTRQDLLEQREQLLSDFQDAVSAANAPAAAALHNEIEGVQMALANASQVDGLPLLTAQSAAELQARLGENAALLFIVESDIETHVFVVTPDNLVSDSAAASTLTIRQHVADLRDSLESGASTDFDTEAAQALQRALFTPAISNALQGRSDISLVARGDLAKLPFSILVDPDGRFMVETIAFSYPITLDSVSISSSQPAPRFATFLGIGAPDLPGVAQTERSFPDEGDNATIAALGRLEFAEGELRALGQAVGADESRIMVGPGATEAALRSANIGQTDMLTFATHGLMAGELDGVEEAALVLTPPADGETVSSDNDGLLTASEIATFDLATRWVVLSACNSASGDGADDEAFGGLAQAFLFAGADALLVSHWRVRDDAAAYLTVATAQGAASGISPAESLRQAQLALMRSDTVPDARHPAIWAPFVYVGQ